MSFSMQVGSNKEIFTVVFQPIINIKEQRIVSMEALSRVRSGRNIESVIKQIKLDGGLRHFTLALLKEIKELSNLLPKTVRHLSLNLSIEHMCQSCIFDDLHELNSELLKRNTKLVIELPEREAYPVPNSPMGCKLIKNIRFLKSHGILIAVDDFGKGFHVSEAIVLRLMPNVLKIDKAVVQKPKENRDVWEMVSSIKKKLNVSIIAEGIENLDDLAFVVKEGIQLCQGFYFGKPTSLLA
ncbi:EAL domain-containing protein [Vibrio campbellii]|uniref:EAL domain-containing protein n=1 Tax=Vibrio campbellii TaxID=680 RepID=UPI0005ED9018|nr:EAL domain-containing protein [Vibrio campbellii]